MLKAIELKEYGNILFNKIKVNRHNMKKIQSKIHKI